MTKRTKRLIMFVVLAALIGSAEFTSGYMVVIGFGWWPTWLVGLICGAAFVRIWFLGRRDGIEFGDYEGGWVKDNES